MSWWQGLFTGNYNDTDSSSLSDDNAPVKRSPGWGWLDKILAKSEVGIGEFCQRIHFPGICGEPETIADDEYYLEHGVNPRPQEGDEDY